MTNRPCLFCDLEDVADAVALAFGLIVDKKGLTKLAAMFYEESGRHGPTRLLTAGQAVSKRTIQLIAPAPCTYSLQTQYLTPECHLHSVT